MPKFLAVDFYCGAGGTTRGLLNADGYVIAGIDNDVDCQETYQHNNINSTLDAAVPAFLANDMFPSSVEYPQGQQHEVMAKLGELIPRYREAAKNVPLMFAICAPCQSFNKFVQRRLTEGRISGRDREQDLLAQTLGFIERFQPEMIVSENVATIRRGRYRRVWESFQLALRGLGYVVGEDTVCASRFGVAQRRRRSILLAYRSQHGLNPIFNPPIPYRDPEASQISTHDAIGHLPSLQAGESRDGIPNHVCRNLTEINRWRLMSVKPGEPNFGFAKSEFGDLSLECHRRLRDEGKTGFGDVYTRMHPDRPAPTITTRFHSVSNGRFGHYDVSQVRALSLREGAALQSFSDDYEFFGSGMDIIAKMIGNAVPPKLSAFMAGWVFGLWNDTASDLKLSLGG
ncbi:MAG: DNA cytosine methyltransferase [Chloroflexi bacterium]|nr:DNA cytosine methyltransferase [Chloroflexota bacterium]